MSMADYYKYLKVRDAALDVEEAYRNHCAAEGRRCVDPALGVPEEARFVTVTDQSRAPRVIDVLHELYYCIDFDLPKYLPELDADLTRNFAFDTLPSGRRCALRCVCPCRWYRRSPQNAHPLLSLGTCPRPASRSWGRTCTLRRPGPSPTFTRTATGRSTAATSASPGTTRW